VTAKKFIDLVKNAGLKPYIEVRESFRRGGVLGLKLD